MIAYGSPYPFDFSSCAAGLEEFIALFTSPELAMERGDLVGNLLLFAPYGFIAALHARMKPALMRLLWLGAALALILQTVQLWLPSRVPALGDVVINIAGMVMGVAAARLAAPLLPSTAGSRSPSTFFPAGLMLCWLAYQWFPLVPTIDLQNVINALKPLLLSPQLDIARTLHTAVTWAAFFKLSEHVLVEHGAAPTLAAAALAIVAAKVMIVGASISLGRGLAIAMLSWRSKPTALPALIVAMLLSLFVSGLSPFSMQSTPQAFHWIPFTGMLEGDMGNNLMNLVEKVYFYGALLLLLLMAWHGARPMPAAFAVAICLAVIKAAQIFIVGRTAESTDPALALILGFVIRPGRPLRKR
ncbi:VanZ family protein [Thauera sp. Sel9]|uniref:VanZ family protein n=1 Tax=Thauera sp. Sel9 TaxID=2974299 RepID=UPI0021E13B9E|nr:VanZ family protein [Thauera sp. Sel9]MCV2217547.1 VanZ family protein [Thauera sp. Sel9]